jgi:hypothetical protein
MCPTTATQRTASSDPKLIMLRNQLIPTLRRQELASDNHRARAEETETPADKTKDPRLVEFPADEEPVLVVE